MNRILEQLKENKEKIIAPIVVESKKRLREKIDLDEKSIHYNHLTWIGRYTNDLLIDEIHEIALSIIDFRVGFKIESFIESKELESLFHKFCTEIRDRTFEILTKEEEDKISNEWINSELYQSWLKEEIEES